VAEREARGVLEIPLLAARELNRPCICSLGSTGGTPVARFKSYGSVEVMGRPWTSSLRSLCTLSIDQ